MDFNTLAFPAVVVLGLTALVILLSHDWRLSISALGVMYISVFILVVNSWSVEMAVVKLVAGWISASVLGMGLVNQTQNLHYLGRYFPSEILFRISAAVLIGLAVFSSANGLIKWLPGASVEQIFGGLLLIGMSLLLLGFTQQPLRTVIGLLTLIAGFEILYSAVESSVLVAGFLAVINMAIALVGTYLLLAPTLEVEE